MGKKRSRAHRTSKGERSSVSKVVVKAVSRDVDILDRELSKLKAWEEGKNPWITIFNPDSKKNSYIKVRANAFYGDYKYRHPNIYRGRNEE